MASDVYLENMKIKRKECNHKGVGSFKNFSNTTFPTLLALIIILIPIKIYTVHFYHHIFKIIILGILFILMSDFLLNLWF